MVQGYIERLNIGKELLTVITVIFKFISLKSAPARSFKKCRKPLLHREARLSSATFAALSGGRYGPIHHVNPNRKNRCFFVYHAEIEAT